MRDFIQQQGIRPELVVCSSALRTRQTLAGILPALGPELAVSIEPSIYRFDADELLDRIRRIPAAVGSAMLIGHNPAFQDLAVMLTARGPGRDAVQRKFPAGALAEIDLTVSSWQEVSVATGELVRFITPRDLEEG